MKAYDRRYLDMSNTRPVSKVKPHVPLRAMLTVFYVVLLIAVTVYMRFQ